MTDTSRHDRLLSVIIPVRNGGPDFSVQLDALAAQDFPGAWELIVVDNGSVDDTREILARSGPEFASLRVLNASDQPGQAHALNIGATNAGGDALVFLDADDVVEREYLSAMRRALDESPFVGARLECASLNLGWVGASRPAMQQDDLGTPFGFLPTASGCSIGIRRSTFLAGNGCDPTFGLTWDVDLSWRLQLDGIPLTFVPDAVLHYRYRPTLRGIFSQARGYGAAGPRLYHRYRTKGMPRRPWWVALRFHGALLVRIVRIRNRADVAHCVFLAGYRLGIIAGCIESRVLYL